MSSDWSQADRDLARQLKEGGLTLQEIGDLFGVSRQRVAQIIGPGVAQNAQRQAAQRRRFFKAVAIAAKHELARRHGTRYRYVQGCSCVECRAANTAYYKQVRRRKGAKEYPEWRVKKMASKVWGDVYPEWKEGT